MVETMNTLGATCLIQFSLTASFSTTEPPDLLKSSEFFVCLLCFLKTVPSPN